MANPRTPGRSQRQRPIPCAAILGILALVACSQTFPPIPVSLRTASAVRAAPARGAGCFSGQLGPEPWAQAVVQAAVKLRSPNGFEGSGFIVHDSGDASDPHNKMLTAVHVVDARPAVPGEGSGAAVLPDPPGLPGSVTVTAYNGKVIGEAEVVVRGLRRDERIPDGRDVPRGDEAVLRMKVFYEGGAAAYDLIRGADLAPVQSDRLLVGLFSDPGGVDHGASGTMAVDGDGQVAGLLIRTDTISAGSASPMWQVRQKVTAGTNVWSLDNGGLVPGTTEIALFTRSWAFAEPITDGDVLAALGAAGFAVDRKRHGSSAISVQAPGYPLGHCVLYRGDMAPNIMTALR